MEKKVSILLVGIGGYGNLYVNELLDHGDEHNVEIAGIVDPFPQGCKRFNDLQQADIPMYHSIEEFYQINKADLAIISSPIHYHCEQVCIALSNGSNVLCEKPISATPVEAMKMLEMQKRTGEIVGIGYQWSYSKAMLDLKKDILKGVFGKPVRLKTLVLWPRDKKYFARGWAGKVSDDHGRMILDSVANNATAHYLHNMFFVLGEAIDKSAIPDKVTAELYRANNIENFDTVAARVMTKCGVELCFYASHAILDSWGPVFEYEFENASVFYDGSHGENVISAKSKDGTEKIYGDPFDEDINKLWTLVDAIRGKGTIPCTIETAFSHTLCIDAMHRSVPDIHNFSDAFKCYDEQREIVWVDGLGDVLKTCYSLGVLPSEIGASWAITGKTVDV